MKKTVVRLLSLLLIFSLGLGIMPLSLAETLPAESGNGITYQGINLEAGGQKPLTKAETDYYTEICDILRKNRNKKQMTVTEGDKTKVYTLSGQGDAAGLQEAVYQGKKAEASSLSSVSNISFSNRSAGQSVSDPDAGSRSSSATNAMNMLKDWKEKKNSPTPVTFTAQQGGASGQKADADSKEAVTDGAANKSVGTLVSNNNASVSVKDASAASFRELYNSSVDGGPVTITAEELLQYIELGDEMAIEFAESLGFGRSEKKQKENLSAMVEEYKTHSDYKEPAFIINGVMIGLDKEIQEDTENGGYRTDVSVNASASVTIVYDEKGEAKVMRRVSSDDPTDFIITLDATGSMQEDGRGTAMLSALEVLLEEILAKPENTVSIIFWGSTAAVMRIDIDQGHFSETVFSGEAGYTVENIYGSTLIGPDGNPDSYNTKLEDYKTIGTKAIISRLEKLFGPYDSTKPHTGLEEAIKLLDTIQQSEDRNLGVLLFTDGESSDQSTGVWKRDFDSENKTIDYEKWLVEQGIQVVNVSIGDEAQVEEYRSYLDPKSQTYRGGENEQLQENVLYYNIPKLTNEQLAERITEMFSTAFSEMTTEMVQLKSETVTTGVLAAVKTKVIETIPAGFQVKRSGRTYTVEGTDENGNTIVSFDLGNLMAGNGKTVSYFTVPQDGQKDIGVTAYTSAAGTSLYVEPVNRFHFKKYNEEGRETQNERGVEVVYKESRYTFGKKMVYAAPTVINENHPYITAEMIAAPRLHPGETRRLPISFDPSIEDLRVYATYMYIYDDDNHHVITATDQGTATERLFDITDCFHPTGDGEGYLEITGNEEGFLRIDIESAEKHTGDYFTVEVSSRSFMDYEAYFRTLSGLPADQRALDNYDVRRMIYEELLSESGNEDLATNMMKKLEEAPAIYSNLYAWSFPDYVRNFDPSRPGSYHIASYLQVDVDTLDVFFHESGHAIDYSMDHTDRSSSEDYKLDLYVSLWSDVSRIIMKYFSGENSIKRDLSAEEKIEIMQYVMGPAYSYNEEKYINAAHAYEFIRSPYLYIATASAMKVASNEAWKDIPGLSELQSGLHALGGDLIETNYAPQLSGDFSKEQKDYYEKLSEAVQKDLLSHKTEGDMNSQMYHDMIAGLTNQALQGRDSNIFANKMRHYCWVGHGPLLSKFDKTGNYSEDYWYNKDNGNPTYAQNNEAWAEYFSSQITGNNRQDNQENFSEACRIMDEMAEELLKDYREKHAQE